MDQSWHITLFFNMHKNHTGAGFERSTSMASWYFSGLLDAFQTSIRYFLLGRETSSRLVRSNGSKDFQGTR